SEVGGIKRDCDRRLLVAINHAWDLSGAARGTGGPLADLRTRGSLQLFLGSHRSVPCFYCAGPPPGVPGAGRRSYTEISRKRQCACGTCREHASARIESASKGYRARKNECISARAIPGSLQWPRFYSRVA